jgi:hypothetical protein
VQINVIMCGSINKLLLIHNCTKDGRPTSQTQLNKLDKLQVHKSKNNHNKQTMKYKIDTHLANLTQITLSREQIQTFNLGSDYAIEKDPK